MDARESPTSIWLLLDSSAIGGIETHVLALAGSLRTLGIDPTIVFLKNHGAHPLYDRLTEAGLNWFSLDGSFFGLIGKLRKERPAILHTHGYKAGILGRFAGQLTATPTVSTFHSGDPGKGRVRLYTETDRLSAFLGRSIAVSAPIQASLPRGSTLISNGVPLPEDIAPYPGKQVAFVGRFAEEKGPDHFCVMASKFPNIDAHLYGDGPMRAGLETQYGNQMTFHGAVPDMTTYWANIGLLVMPSRAEGLPMAALEAMARGIPVAAFDVGDLGMLTAEKRGWLTPPEALDALFESVRTWMRQTEQELLGRRTACRDFIRDRYSADAMARCVVEEYREVAKR